MQMKDGSTYWHPNELHQKKSTKMKSMNCKPAAARGDRDDKAEERPERAGKMASSR